MCGWWLPMGAEDNAQRAAEIAEAQSLNENASRYGAALQAPVSTRHGAQLAPPPEPYAGAWPQSTDAFVIHRSAL